MLAENGKLTEIYFDNYRNRLAWMSSKQRAPWLVLDVYDGEIVDSTKNGTYWYSFKYIVKKTSKVDMIRFCHTNMTSLTNKIFEKVLEVEVQIYIIM